VLLWNKAKEKSSMHTKFEELWIRPYVIEKIWGFNSYMLQDMKEKNINAACQWETFERFLFLRLFHSHCT
jgi:hypothetical protein